MLAFNQIDLLYSTFVLEILCKSRFVVSELVVASREHDIMYLRKNSFLGINKRIK